MAKTRTIQLLRNTNASAFYASKELAKAGLASVSGMVDGEIAVARYYSEGTIKSLLGVYHLKDTGTGQNGWTFIEDASDLEQAVDSRAASLEFNASTNQFTLKDADGNTLSTVQPKIIGENAVVANTTNVELYTPGNTSKVLTLSAATSSAAGVMTAAQATKLENTLTVYDLSFMDNITNTAEDFAKFEEIYTEIAYGKATGLWQERLPLIGYKSDVDCYTLYFSCYDVTYGTNKPRVTVVTLNKSDYSREESHIDIATENYVSTLINALDLAQVGGTSGSVITAVSQTDGQVAASTSNLSDVLLTGYAKTNDAGSIAATDSLEVALSKIENNLSQNEITVESYTGKDQDGTTDLPANVKVRYRVLDADDTPLGVPIDIYKDSALQSVALLHAYESGSSMVTPTYSNGVWTDVDAQYQTEENLALVYAYLDTNGATQVVAVPVGNFLRESEFADGLQVSSGVVSVKVDTASEKVAISAATESAPVSILSVSSNGVKVDNIQAAIDYSISKLDVSQVGGSNGSVITAVSQTNGEVSASTSSLSDVLLTGYTNTSATGAVAANDSVENAVSKLENTAAVASGNSAISVSAKTAGSAQNVGLVLDDSTNSGDNVLTITNGEGLYLSSVWDCGTYSA